MNRHENGSLLFIINTEKLRKQRIVCCGQIVSTEFFHRPIPILHIWGEFKMKVELFS